MNAGRTARLRRLRTDAHRSAPYHPRDCWANGNAERETGRALRDRFCADRRAAISLSCAPSLNRAVALLEKPTACTDRDDRQRARREHKRCKL